MSVNPTRILLTTPVAEGASAIYTANFLDESGAAVVPQTLSLTIADTKTGAVVNGVEAQDILNTGRGVVNGDGRLTLTLLPADTMLADGVTKALRSLVFDWTYGAGKTGRHEVMFPINALAAS